jgi:23S rRNA (uridine2479-2'-O)-methyltransferase
VKTLTIQKENATYQILTALKTNRQKRSKRGEIFVEGVAAINAAAENGVPAVWIAHSEERQLSGWAKDTIACLDPEAVLVLSNELITELSDRADPSELIVIFKRPVQSLEKLNLSTAPLIAVIDRPSNTGNLGSILRSCDAFGADAVITTGHGVDLYDSQVIRASLGAVFSPRLCHEPSAGTLMTWIDSLKASTDPLQVIGTDSNGEYSLRDVKIRRPAVIIFGNEATGISVALRSYVDQVVAIPIGGSVNSLNLASAASIFLYSVE